MPQGEGSKQENAVRNIWIGRASETFLGLGFSRGELVMFVKCRHPQCLNHFAESVEEEDWVYGEEDELPPIRSVLLNTDELLLKRYVKKHDDKELDDWADDEYLRYLLLIGPFFVYVNFIFVAESFAVEEL